MHRYEHSGVETIRTDATPTPAPRADDNVSKIVKKKQFVIDPMTADDAVLQMELLGHDFFLFTNAETGRSAVVYMRDDGDVGLIDAE